MTQTPDAAWEQIDRLLDLALAEDIGPGDATTAALVPAGARASGQFVARAAGVLAGLEIVERLYARLDAEVLFSPVASESSRVEPGTPLAHMAGPARAILSGERIALNLLQRMSGVATLTRTYVEAVAHTHAKIYDTRKTMPGLRRLDKLAVCVGGGENHRQGLYDMILIKDNHLRLCTTEDERSAVGAAVARARAASDLPVMLEVDTLDQLDEALAAGPEMVLLDNMDLEELAQAVKRTHQAAADQDLARPLLEASGGIDLETVRAIAETGVDRISVGALTHSAVAMDIGLDLD
jgi:nicotinate-nucleotide pyrophosphorylase (carboxylating)